MTASDSRVGRILIVDDDSGYLDATRGLLETAGYRVFVATTVRQAKEILARKRIHVALFDVRLVEDLNPPDTSGLTFAAEVDPGVAKIMLTKYPNYELVQEAMDPLGRTRANFVSKEEGPDRLLTTVDQVFKEKVRINFDLAIHLQGLLLEQVASEIGVQQHAPEVVMSEVEEILCKLFFDAKEIILFPLIPTGRSRLSSQSGSAVLKVKPIYSRRGVGIPVVVKLAGRHRIVKEAENYEDFVKGFVGDHRRTNLDRFTEANFLGGIVYSLVGISLDHTVDLGTFYHQHSAAEIIETLDNLFNNTCLNWYENRQTRQTHNLTRLYCDALQMSAPKIEAALQAGELAAFIPRLPAQFHNQGHTFKDPLEWFENNPNWVVPLHTCVTHGDLHSANVLLDDQNQVWLIDFYRTGWGHILRDLIELETDIKFKLLEATNFPTLFQFEKALLTPKHLGDQLSPPNFDGRPELEKAFTVVAHLRHIAGRILGPKVEMKEYYWGLALLTLNALRLKSIDRTKKQRHVLPSAALLVERLQTFPALPPGWTASAPTLPPEPEKTSLKVSLPFNALFLAVIWFILFINNQFELVFKKLFFWPPNIVQILAIALSLLIVAHLIWRFLGLRLVKIAKEAQVPNISAIAELLFGLVGLLHPQTIGNRPLLASFALAFVLTAGLIWRLPPACPPAGPGGTKAPDITLHSITFVVDGVDQIIDDTHHALQLSKNSKMTIKEAVICVPPFENAGGRFSVEFEPYDPNHRLIDPQSSSPQDTVSGFTTIPGPNHTWTIADWQKISVLSYHFPPGGTQNANCQNSTCEIDDRLKVNLTLQSSPP